MTLKSEETDYLKISSQLNLEKQGHTVKEHSPRLIQKSNFLEGDRSLI